MVKQTKTHPIHSSEGQVSLHPIPIAFYFHVDISFNNNNNNKKMQLLTIFSQFCSKDYFY